MYTLNQVISKVDVCKYKSYNTELSKLKEDQIISESDVTLIQGVLDSIKQNNINSAIHSLEWVGDTHIRDIFTRIVINHSSSNTNTNTNTH